jgi:ABC-type phosphate transport system substrate-binding protein
MAWGDGDAVRLVRIQQGEKMQTPFGKRRISGGLAIAVGIAAFGGSLMSTEAAFAAPPASGINCVSSDGKINGRGSTYQTRAQGDFWTGFDSDVCGAVASQGSNDVTVAGQMGIYNYPSTGLGAGFTGSGNGLKAANCRTDAYAGTDLPYSEAQLAGLNGAPGNSVIGGCSTYATQPFAPDATTNGTTFPAAADQEAPIMSFPIAGSSVDIAVNLTAADCGGTKPSNLKFTPAQMTYLWGGNAVDWNDATLVTGNPSLANCTTPVTRVVRQDNSGTTSIFKSYLINIDDARSAATCDPGATWTSFDGSPNTSWPTGSGTCDALAVPTTSGGPALVSLLGTTNGGVGFADLADMVASTVPVITASVQNAAGTSYQAPGSGKAANCDYSVLTLPGATASDSVGLNSSDNWGSDNATVNGAANHVNATDLGVKYPICGLTFDLVYTNLGLGGGSSPNAIVGLTADQRRTLYSFITYVLSSTAQSKLPNDYYAALPTAWLPFLVGGFQGNF